ncbi:MAG: MMPL family transporter [Candidatus Aenigmarchaeota archaeon]|nr:MMPL family transporter [Candidatus Aenigmarchaeota archaeon]
MSKLDTLKNWKVLLLIVLVIGSIIAIGPNFSPDGVTVTYVSKNSTVPLAAGDIIYKINGNPAMPEDFQKQYTGVTKLDTNKGEKYVKVNGTLGIEAKQTPSTRISFGLDMEGGVRAVIKPETIENDTLERIISTLQTRINIYGLKEASFRSIQSDDEGFVEIVMAGGNREELEDLLQRQGKFEATIPIMVETGKTLEFEKEYTITVLNNSIKIGDYTLQENQTIELDNIPLTLLDIENQTANISTKVFTGNDIILVYFDPQKSGIEPLDNGFRWFFLVKLSEEGAQKFARVTQNLDTVFSPSGSRLSSMIYLYLDDEMIDSLSISADLKGQIVQEPSITGYAVDSKEAFKSQRKLQTILKSGSLPTKIEIVQLDVISPKLGSKFLTNIIIAIIAAVIAVSVIVAVRYRKKEIVIPMLATSMSEIIIIFGASVAIGWTIDIASVAAIIAIIGTGIDAQIILVDQAMRTGKETVTAKEKIKRALFIIFGAGGTVIGAMLPLTVLGLGVLRGFAITTILGVLIGIFITRPAFGEIIKKIVN